MSECVLYWLHDAHCICLQRHGYVGISERFTTRLGRHKQSGTFPPGFAWTILFRGSRDECLAMEESLRPTWAVGWNKLKGGLAGGTAPKPSEQRAKMSAAARARYQNPIERELARQQQIGKHDHRGVNNPRHGVALSDETKARIRRGRKGKGLGNQNWLKRSPYTADALRKMSEASKRRWARQTPVEKEIGYAR
jgi:hypothetical protein